MYTTTLLPIGLYKIWIRNSKNKGRRSQETIFRNINRFFFYYCNRNINYIVWLELSQEEFTNSRSKTDLKGKKWILLSIFVIWKFSFFLITIVMKKTLKIESLTFRLSNLKKFLSNNERRYDVDFPQLIKEGVTLYCAII